MSQIVEESIKETPQTTWWMYLSIHDPEEDVWTSLMVGEMDGVWVLKFGDSIRTEHRVGQDWEKFLRDLYALEPNRWREGDNLARVEPPLGEFVSLEGQHLLRAMALVMAGGGKEGVLELAKSPFQITGPGKQFRFLFMADPDALLEEELDMLDVLYREGFLIEWVVNPRGQMDGPPMGGYLSVPWNKALFPKTLALEGKDAPKAQALWQKLEKLSEAGRQIQID